MRPPQGRFLIESCGVAIDIEIRHCCTAGDCEFVALDAEVEALLPPGTRPRTDPSSSTASFVVECHRGELRLTDAAGSVSTFPTLAPCLHALDQAIRSVIAVEAPGLVFIHAGVVAIEGRAMVLPGKSMAGKTTLVARLVATGATYLSDEYAVFDAQGLVHPYPRRLSMRDAHAPGGRRQVPVGELNGVAAEHPVPVGLVAALEYQQGAKWSVGPGDQAACATALVANAVAAQLRSTEVLTVAARIARMARYVAGVRGDAASAAQILSDLARP